MLVKSGRPHFNIFEQQDAKEISTCILDELCGNFILALDLVQVKIRVTVDCWFSHHTIDKKESFTILQLSVATFTVAQCTVQLSLDLFLTPKLHSGVNSFFCNYSSSLQPGIIEHGFSRVRQFLIIQLKPFVNFQ